MNIEGGLLLLILFCSLGTALLLFFVREQNRALRTTLNLVAAGLKLALVGKLVLGIYQERSYEFSMALMPGIELSLRADALSVLFITLSSVLWFLTTIYAIGYLERAPNCSRFFGFFSLCVSATTGIALAGNLITFLIFYELLTIATYPLVVHKGTPQALRAGKIYLCYTLVGGTVLLLAIAWLKSFAGTVAFAEGGALTHLVEVHPGKLTVVFAMLIAGLGVKTALVPFHGWLPNAMVAPAPVSSLLHAVAVVKAGAFGIVRVVYEVFGIETCAHLGVLQPLAIVASVTIIYGSGRALMQTNLKKRLAYSTVSQVSYITLGTAIFGPVASIGGIVHLVHQGVMKITLFFAAGNYAETLGVHEIKEMDGIGKKMPWTSLCFSIGALGMIGVPPLAGYVSKWYLQKGGLVSDQAWISGVLSASSLLNAAYFLPILYRMWFRDAAASWPKERNYGRWETHWMLLVPCVVTATLIVYFGVFAETSFSPLYWAKLIVTREYPSE